MAVSAVSPDCMGNLCAVQVKGRYAGMKKERRQQLKKGVMTVEASVIYPLLCMMTALLLVCVFYRHNLNYYTAAAAESAMRGNAAAEGGEDRPEQQAAISAASRTADQPVPGSIPQAEVFCGEGVSTVSFSGQRFAAFTHWFSWETGISVRKVHPVGAIRQAWRMQPK